MTILQSDDKLDFKDKRYFIKYILAAYLKDYRYYNRLIYNIKNNDNELIKASFYYFAKKSTLPRYLSRNMSGKISITTLIY